MPKIKTYVLLHNDTDANGAYMLVPVKAALNPYSNKPAYCAAMPQFFGGTGTDLEKEVTEESRKTILYTDTVPQLILETEVDDVTYTFYKSSQWKLTGTKWNNAPGSKSEREMQVVVRLERAEFLELKGEEIIYKLLELTQIQGLKRTNKALQDFADSETKTAFILFIESWLNEPGRVNA